MVTQSEISIIIVSVAGLGAFASPSVELSRSLSIIRFLFIIFASLAGLLGTTFAFFVLAAMNAASSTYGVPFLSPLTPRNSDFALDGMLVKPIWKKELRPQSLKTQNPIRQPHISRKWLEKRKGE